MSNEHSEQAPGHNKSYSITVNGRPREVTAHRVSYRDVVELAFPGSDPNIVYTVTFANPHGHDGSLAEGQTVEIKNGMSFNVIKTNRS